MSRKFNFWYEKLKFFTILIGLNLIVHQNFMILNCNPQENSLLEAYKTIIQSTYKG